ncbi:MAG TPA: DNA repair protein RadC [Candidatus Deferrimicrobium sp.]|nr:DNA repair protein RadC [Candidatus Deferrimicrobium sp.]
MKLNIVESPVVKSDMPVKIKDIPSFDRPREKMVKKGSKSLSNLELVAAILGSGCRGKDVYEVAGEIVQLVEKDFEKLSVTKLKRIGGMGTAKACQIMAAVEFSRRFLFQEGILIKTDRDVFNLVSEVADQKQEYFLTLTVDGANHLIEKRTVFIGTLNQSLIHPREIFADALNDRAAGIILAHNHPSGKCEPSKEDYDVTDRLVKVGKFMGIDIMDHLIISKNGYYSFERNGYFNKKK